MVENKVAPMREYKTLEDFISGQNNFYLYFMGDSFTSNIYRQKSHFQRFKKQYPEMEQELTKATIQARRAKPQQNLPYELLWEAYKIMSKLVFIDDEYVIRDGKPDSWFLCR